MKKMKIAAAAMMAASVLLGTVTVNAADTKGKILVIASGEDQMTLKNGSIMNVGFFLNEFAVPSQYLAGEGYEIVLATPEGKKPVMDASSNDKAIFIPGGHAPMMDLMQSKDLGKMLRTFHEKGKPTAMICHGPVAALSALPNAASLSERPGGR